MAGRRQRRATRPNPKPYGFCCFPHDEILPRRGLDPSLPSLTSLHECPALKIREQEIVKRPLEERSKDGIRGSSAFKLSLQSLGSGGIRMADATESMIEMMIDMMRAQRQAEYEERMDRWAAIGARKTKERKMKKLKCGPPCWYTDYSLSQLQHLKDLEDAMFKDKKENTINRTAHCLASIGMTTDFVAVNSQVLRKLVNDYSTDIKTFICEVYKAIRGNYFEDEGIRLDYTTHERIMISGVVFLELPQVILELHKRLPAIVKFKFPQKPKPPKLIIAKKMISPLLEKLYPTVNWKLYATQLFKWRNKCLTIPRPIAVLPKETKIIADDNADNDEQQKAIDEKIIQLDDDNQADVKRGKRKDTAIELDSKVKISTSDAAIDKNSQEMSVMAEGHQGDKPLFTIEMPWTEPPTACPMKYIKLFHEIGPLKSDADFFSQLNRQPCKSQVSPSFRLQSVLLDAEADMYGLMHVADELTGEVTRIAKEILEPDTGCDACCPCKETRRAHLMWHATKAPHAVVDGVVTDEKYQTQVIGAMAMHSPAESISSTSQPPCVPSTDKFVKNKIITGTTTIVDGEPVNLIAGFTKTVEHVSREILRPNVEIVEVKNVPPCGCRDEKKNELEQQILSTKKDEGLCYGKKFRPEDGPAYTCNDFGKKDEQEGRACGENYGECYNENECACKGDWEERFEEDDCGCGDDVEKCADNKDAIVKGLKQKRVVCKRCGRELDAKCIDSNAKNLRRSATGKKVTNKCSCDSLSEFLQMDIGKAKCVMPKKDYYTKEKSGSKGKSKKGSRKKEKSTSKEKTPRIKVEKSDRVKKLSHVVIKQDLKIHDEEKEFSVHDIADVAGPYGYRTKSEEALPVERTLAYLTDPHPAIRPAERIPVREGGRPCCCRENRNKRKTLLYGIGALVNENEANVTQLIEGLTWITPEPSIRGSDEYIPEYELADSPYEKHICGDIRKGDKRAKGGNDNPEGQVCGVKEGSEHFEENSENRTRDWENAIQDEYLTEFFTKNRDGVPCWTKCAKFKKKNAAPRKLKVMKPVCECKYERRIVKRNEERKRWQDRQQRLKSLDKEAFLHIDEIVKPVISDSDKNCEIHRDVTLISAVTMQTPCDTPEEGRSRSQLPYSVQNVEIANKNNETKEAMASKAVQRLELSKIEDESSPFESKVTDTKVEVVDPQGKVEVNGSKQMGEEEKEDVEKVIVLTGKMKQRLCYLDQAEEELASVMHAELKRMAVEDKFVSLKLPNYHKLAQLSYWISYRVRGLCFTEKFKKDLMFETTKTWNAKRLTKKASVESLKVKKEDRCKLNFDHAKYWKRKIGKFNRKFYAKTRQDVIEIGREMWPTMEFGKFPHLLFKQAYFTYLPPREVDIYAFRTYSMK